MTTFKPLLMALACASLCFFGTHALAKSYVVDTAASTISFSGTHAGKPFEGRFNDWHATVDFDPEDLKKSSLKATIQLKSTQTNNGMYDGTLPTLDWFDIKNHPVATFESTDITKEPDGSFKATGIFTLKGVSLPVSIPFTLSDLSQSPVTANAQFSLDRLALGIGKQSDPKAEWVSQVIGIKMNIVARTLVTE